MTPVFMMCPRCYAILQNCIIRETSGEGMGRDSMMKGLGRLHHTITLHHVTFGLLGDYVVTCNLLLGSCEEGLFC